MIYSSILLTLTAGAAAIDIRMRPGNAGCSWSGGGWVSCNNIDPNVCCHIDPGMQTIWLAAIPDNWNVGAQTWSDTGCKNGVPILQWGGRNGPDLCRVTGGNNMHGGSYTFLSKRSEPYVSEGCKQADTFVLGDGVTQYNITGLPAAAINELFELSDKFTAPTDMPQHVKDLLL